MLPGSLRVGVIGCGGMGRDHIRRLTEKIQGAEVVAVSDVFEESARKSSAGAQSNHINHVTTQMQYAAVVAVVCIIGYIIAGLVQIWW